MGQLPVGAPTDETLRHCDCFRVGWADGLISLLGCELFVPLSEDGILVASGPTGEVMFLVPLILIQSIKGGKTAG